MLRGQAELLMRSVPVLVERGAMFSRHSLMVYLSTKLRRGYKMRVRSLMDALLTRRNERGAGATFIWWRLAALASVGLMLQCVQGLTDWDRAGSWRLSCS